MDIRTSPLVQGASEAKRPTPWWLGWIVAAVIVVGGAFAGSAIGAAVLGNPAVTETRHQFIEFFSFGASLLLLWLWVRFKEGRAFSSVGFRGGRAVPKLLLGFVIGGAMMVAATAIPLLTGDLVSDGSKHTTVGAAALLPLLALALVFFWQSSTEEAITRGYMLQIGGRDLNPWFAILGSSIFFAVIHLDFSPIPLLNITLYAVFASFVALGQGNLWLICGIHTGWNFFQGNVLGLPVSGNPYATSLLALGPAPDGREALTGGDFGIEASLSGTLVLVVVLVVAFAGYRRAEARRVSDAHVPAAS